MFFTENLEELIFQCHESHDADELIILSGYLGPSPVRKLLELPFRTTVVYGMYGSERINRTLHTSLTSIQESSGDSHTIFYSTVPVHSKCYVWKKDGEIVHALMGSANFSNNGLTTPFRESLVEVPEDAYGQLNSYIDRVLGHTVSCLEIDEHGLMGDAERPTVCLLDLLDNNGEVPETAGLNWGQNPRNHTRPNDAYIKVSVDDVRNFPGLFQPKQLYPSDRTTGRAQRHNDAIEIIWDDGTVMKGLLEGSQEVSGEKYPKQVSSHPEKSELGLYMRERIDVASGAPVRREHLDEYGRTNVEVSLLGDGVYSFDFSTN